MAFRRNGEETRRRGERRDRVMPKRSHTKPASSSGRRRKDTLDDPMPRLTAEALERESALARAYADAEAEHRADPSRLFFETIQSALRREEEEAERRVGDEPAKQLLWLQEFAARDVSPPGARLRAVREMGAFLGVVALAR